MKSDRIPVITVDGASGTGKGVVTQCVADQLKWKVLDSGVIYRVLGFAAHKYQIALEAELTLIQMASNLDLTFVASPLKGCPAIFFEGEEVTDAIRTEFMGNTASKVGALPGVRAALLDRQRAFRQAPGLVTDGRDMGTVVFPDAVLKVFLTASLEERALRRYNQLKEKNIHGNLSSLVDELRERDRRDQDRTIAPLKPAEGAICIDTDHLTIQEVVICIMDALKNKGIY